MEQKFGIMVESLKTYKTPRMLTLSIIDGSDDGNIISSEKEELYQSKGDMLPYLVKHSHLDIRNSIHELSKTLDGAYPAAFKKMCDQIYFGYKKSWVEF